MDVKVRDSGAHQRSARSTCLLECNVEWRDEFDVLRALSYSRKTQHTKREQQARESVSPCMPERPALMAVFLLG